MANYRKIYEQYYGVKIPKGYHVHHIDFNHANDDPMNLEALHKDIHAQKHGFLNNFIMAQAKACELAKPRALIVNKGNKYNLGRKHSHEQNLIQSRFMMGNKLRTGHRYVWPLDKRKAISVRQLGKKRGPYKPRKSKIS